MKEKVKYICSNCGLEHDEWPALTFSSPSYYYNFSEKDKISNAALSDDFCIVNDGGNTHRFIRCTLTQRVNDHCEDLEYLGVVKREKL